MINDKRKSPRRAIRYTAWAKLPDGKLHGCALADISDTGARLDFENAAKIPDHFVLLLSARGTPRRKCRVIWRDDNQIGAQFERPLARADKDNAIGRAMMIGRKKPEPEGVTENDKPASAVAAESESEPA